MSRTVFDVIGDLVQCFPKTTFTEGNAAAYERMLRDISVEDLDAAAARLTLRQTFMPSIAEIRQEVFMTKLGFPGVEEAWALALHAARTPRVVECSVCEGSGLFGDLGNRITPEIPDYLSEAAKAMLADLAKVGVMADAKVCLDCNGTGEMLNPKRQPIPAIVSAAMDQVGGVFSIRNADKPEVIRAQFMKSYERIVADTIDAQNIGSALPPGRGWGVLEA
jgi:hypothetical protein